MPRAALPSPITSPTAGDPASPKHLCREGELCWGWTRRRTRPEGSQNQHLGSPELLGGETLWGTVSLKTLIATKANKAKYEIFMVISETRKRKEQELKHMMKGFLPVVTMSPFSLSPTELFAFSPNKTLQKPICSISCTSLPSSDTPDNRKTLETRSL